MLQASAVSDAAGTRRWRVSVSIVWSSASRTVRSIFTSPGTTGNVGPVSSIFPSNVVTAVPVVAVTSTDDGFWAPGGAGRGDQAIVIDGLLSAPRDTPAHRFSTWRLDAGVSSASASATASGGVAAAAAVLAASIAFWFGAQ